MRSSFLFASLGFAFLSACGSGSSDSTSSAGVGGAAGGSPAGGCEAVRVCCTTLSGAVATACQKAADSAEASSSPAQACSALFSAYQQSGMCAASSAGGAGGGVGAGGASAIGGLGGSTSGTSQPAICARFVSCSTAAAPGSAAGVIAAYGPSGSCWQSTPGIASDCTTACQKGIAQLHGADPKDCPVCLSDKECSGATPACDLGKGECVACTSDANCPGGACDTSKDVCVQCNSDAQCTSPSAAVCDGKTHKCVPGCTSDALCTSSSAPHCNVSTHGCVECTGDAQCAGNAAGPSCVGFSQKCGCFSDFQCPSLSCGPDATCCTPKPCPVGACGMVDNGCGTKVDCGGCAKGVCQAAPPPGISQCDASGVVCDPAAGDCPGKQRCLYDDKKYAYVCAPNEEGQQCLYTDDCKFLGGNKVDTYFCNSGGALGKCTPYCLVQGDCTAPKTCTMFGSPIGPMSPGVCL